MNTNGVVSWLRFYESAITDECGNTWTAYGSPIVSDDALQLNGSSYVANADIAANIANSPWTIHWRAACQRNGQEDFFFGTFNANYGTSGEGNRKWVSVTYNAGNPKLVLWADDTVVSANLQLNQSYHYALSYDGTSLRFFIDGVVKLTKTPQPITLGGAFRIGCTAGRQGSADFFQGSIDEFIILKGIAWTEDFTPPTAEDYTLLALELDGQAPLTLQIDVERTVRNTIAVSFTTDVERKLKHNWRYVNMGDVHDLTQSATFLTNLPDTQSKTGVAFYQTTRAKCFDLPATPEIWAKFDVCFNGSNRWRAYNGGSNGTTGITAQTDGQLGFFSNNTDKQHISGICKTNQLQTVLLHMVSGTNGLIEAWVDGTKIYTFNGDVNHGEDFADVYLQSDGSGTFFSNVLIKNYRIDFDEGWQSFTIDTERITRKTYQIDLDVQRTAIEPVIVPLIGEHFNHYVMNIKTYNNNTAQRIILPRESKVCVRGLGVGSIKVFSDTDTTGEITGDEVFEQGNMYAELEECGIVFIKATDTTATAQQIIKAMIKSLCQTTLQGAEALDEAINYATKGSIETYAILTNSFLSDLNNAVSAVYFLQDKCGIILDNADTGAISGSDAGGDSIKTASSIVPEQIQPENWVAPASGSSTTINGLIVHFPTSGVNGDLSEIENHILAGLNSEWIRQGLQLIKESLGIDFNGDNITVRDIYIKFENNEDSHTTAYINPEYLLSELSHFNLVINMHYYNDIDITNENGALVSSSPMYYSAGYLDRTIVHELTHAVMMSNMNSFDGLPLYIKEGFAELVHGIDDVRSNTIVELLALRKSTLSEIFANGGDAESADPYAAGFLILRYLAKQHVSIAPEEIEIISLTISDGATDSFYNALTDNTRQIFYADTSCELIKTLESYNDIEIRDVIPIEVVADIKRAIAAKVSVHPVRNNLVNRNNAKNVRLHRRGAKSTIENWAIPNQIGTATDTDGSTSQIQKMEIYLSEQQLTEKVIFTGTKKSSECVSVEFLDYSNDLEVVRSQNISNLYTYECCLDSEMLLYTQLDIIGTTAQKEEQLESLTSADNYADEYDYLGAIEIIDTIDKVLNLHMTRDGGGDDAKPIVYFEDFTPSLKFTTRKDGEKVKFYCEKRNITYSDIIREIFGWTSRVPNRMINICTENGKLQFVQRGKEPNTIRLNEYSTSRPIITKEKVRTTWGSTPWSKTVIEETSTSQPTSSAWDLGSSGGSSGRIVTYEDTIEDDESITTKTYEYNREGICVKVVANRAVKSGIQQPNSISTTINNYDNDNNLVKTTTEVNYSVNSDSVYRPRDTRTVTLYSYTKLGDDEKFLTQESTANYEFKDGGWERISYRVTTHSPTRIGQGHSITIDDCGETVGNIVGQNTGDDRITPFAKAKADIMKDRTYEKIDTEKRTLNGFLLYDSSFPLHEESELIEITEALQDLNGKIKTTIQVTVYDSDHLINFLDKIIIKEETYPYEEKTYHLVSNVATSTPRIYCAQSLTLVNWEDGEL